MFVSEQEKRRFAPRFSKDEWLSLPKHARDAIREMETKQGSKNPFHRKPDGSVPSPLSDRIGKKAPDGRKAYYHEFEAESEGDDDDPR